MASCQIATLAPRWAISPPTAATWARPFLNGGLSAKEHTPTPRGNPAGLIYSRVSGVQQGQPLGGELSALPCRF